MNSKALRAHIGTAVFIFALFALSVVTFTLMNASPANAAVSNGGSGSGTSGNCNGGGISGCPWTSNGRGWFKIAVDSPDAPRGNGYWNVANPTCKAEGATHVIAFVIRTGERTLRHGWIYTWIPSEYGYDEDVGNISLGEAQALYDALPWQQKIGYSFGVNVGWFCHDESTEWFINGQSYIQPVASASVGSNINLATQTRPNVTPGNRLYWYHDLRNSGPEDMDKQLLTWVNKSGFSNGWNATNAPSAWRSGTNNQLFWRVYPTGGDSSSYTVYDVRQDDVGNTLCQSIGWNPRSWNSNADGASTAACAYVPYSYTLTPQIIDMTDNEIVENAIGPIEVTGRVTNSGNTKSHTNIEWQLTQVLYAPGAAIPQRGGGISEDNPCTYFTGEIAGSCAATSSGSGTEATGYAYRETKTYDATGNLGDRAVGTRICFAMSIKRNSSANTDWRHSQMYCRVVGKEPKVQVLGGDLIVGRDSASNPGRQSDVDTSVSQPLSGRYFGSWAEYAIVASGNVRGMSSGSGYVGIDGAGSTTDIMCSLSYLTFTNGGNPGCSENNIGLYEHTKASPNIAGRFPISSSTARISDPDVILSDMQGLYTTSQAALNISGGADIGITSDPAKIGQEVIINAPNTTVTITDNINYTTDTLRGTREIPQVVIIARNIIVQDDVQNIDAWLIAVGSGNEGRINTCGGSNDGSITEATLPHAGQCGQRLTINGPVSANHLFLRRTAGSGTGAAAGEPAEVINLRADSYVWATGYSPGTGRLPTVTTTELPPRF